MMVNAVSYGIIIPLLYPYASKFGINPLGLSFLFASFSLAQFIATPIMGRVSDKIGRKPMLVLSIFGTSVSLALFATAWSLPILFVARVLDGLTGGNISVAQAVIADTTKGEARTKAFGILGASFGFGFLFGPAIGGLLSPFGLTVPFWFAAGLALLATFLTIVFLPETLVKNGKIAKEPLFDAKKIANALFDEKVGLVLFITLLVSLAHNSYIIGFQSFAVDVLKMSAMKIGLLFSLLGLIGVLMQVKGIGILLKVFKQKRKILGGASLLAGIVLTLMTFQQSLVLFVILTACFSLTFAPVFIMSAGLVSERTRAEDQGGMLGIRQSYMSLGQIMGPLLAGLITVVSVPAVFLFSGMVLVVSFLIANYCLKPIRQKADI